MKKTCFLIAIWVLGCLGSTAYSQNCNSIFSNFSGGLYLVTDPATGDTLFEPGTENTVYLSTGFQTGDLLLFQVTAGHTYLWTTEIFNSVFFDSYIRVWDATDPAFSLLAEDDDGSGFFSGNSTLIWTACEDGFVWVSVNDWECDNQRTPYNLLSAAIPGTPLSLDAGLDQTAFSGYTPSSGFLNYLAAQASGGDEPYRYTWSGSNIQFEGLTNGRGAAVQPILQGFNDYQVRVTDASGCTAKDSLQINVIDVICANASSSGSGSSDDGDDAVMDHSSSSSNTSSGLSNRSCEDPKVEILMCVEIGSCSGSLDGSSDLESLPMSSSSDDNCMVEKCIKYDPCGRRDRVLQTLNANPNNHLGPCSLTFPQGIDPFEPSTILEMDLVSDFFANETSWEIRDSRGEVIFEGGPGLVDPQPGSASSSPGANYIALSHYGFSLEIEDLRSIYADPIDCYTLTVNDAFGDGMCCLFGQGDYILSFDNATVYVSSGSFPNAEVTEFGGMGCPTGTTFFKTLPHSDQALGIKMDFIRVFPNPAQQTATFELGVGITENTTLEIFNMQGQRMTQLVNHELSPGVHTVDLDCSTWNSGIYLYRWVTPRGVMDGKLIIQQ